MAALQLPIIGKCHLHHEFVLRTSQSSEPCSMASIVNTILPPQTLGLFALTDRVNVMVSGSYSVCACVSVSKCVKCIYYYPKLRTFFESRRR